MVSLTERYLFMSFPVDLKLAYSWRGYRVTVEKLSWREGEWYVEIAIREPFGIHAGYCLDKRLYVPVGELYTDPYSAFRPKPKPQPEKDCPPPAPKPAAAPKWRHTMTNVETGEVVSVVSSDDKVPRPFRITQITSYRAMNTQTQKIPVPPAWTAIAAQIVDGGTAVSVDMEEYIPAEHK